ncbi:hypothetical protein [Nonomuraea sp. NPDC049695]|uniref:hypothetical protein n=1 Tax=Nonomuraea sp. NPDC049695 TaxID=3154734 RepID=UPI00342F867A
MGELNPQSWPGLDDTDDDLYYNVGKMRAVADALELALSPTSGPGGTPQGGRGSVEALTRYFDLNEEHIGKWQAAMALARSVASKEIDTSTYGPYFPGAGGQLGQLYQEFVEHCQKVIKAIRDSADTYDGTNQV